MATEGVHQQPKDPATLRAMEKLQKQVEAWERATPETKEKVQHFMGRHRAEAGEKASESKKVASEIEAVKDEVTSEAQARIDALAAKIMPKQQQG